MKTICIYHGDCMDGAASAAVVVKKFPDAELYSAHHGQPPPQNIDGKRVVIVDFSYEFSILADIKQRAGEFLWFDHHKTAVPVLEQLGEGVIDLNESGATLTWKQLFPGEEVPRILQYVRDKDIWLWQLPDSREVSADMYETENVLKPQSSIWKQWLAGITDQEWQSMLERGHRSRRLMRDRIVKAGKHGFEVILDGHKTLAVNATGDSSELGEYIYKDLGYPVAAIFSFDGNQWRFSLRSHDVDVSDIAVKRGGGGHRGAAGFRVPEIAWLMASKVSPSE